MDVFRHEQLELRDDIGPILVVHLPAGRSGTTQQVLYPRDVVALRDTLTDWLQAAGRDD